MRHIIRTTIFTLLLAPAALPRTRQQQDPQQQLAERVRKELVTLPNYGVYDYLLFELNGGDVVLQGWATTPSLKAAAEKAVANINGVAQVRNEIQVLPLSRVDDAIRYAVFRRIYGEPSLSRYASGGGLMPRDPFLYPPLGWANTPAGAWEPAGNYAIHIIVANGNVSLEGLVGTKMDKDLAAMIVSQIPGVFSVANRLVIG